MAKLFHCASSRRSSTTRDLPAQYNVYILTNFTKTVLYIGITTNIERRMQEHKERTVPGFSSRYNCNRLIFVEEYEYISLGIDREKELKGWRREKKERLINSINPNWDDLYDTIILDS